MPSRARVKRLTGIKSDLDAVTKPGSTHHLCNGISTVKGQRGTGSRKDEHITIQRRLSRKNLAQSTQDLRLGRRFTDNDPQQAKPMQKCFRDDCEYRVAQTEPRFEKPEHVCPLAVPIQPDTAWKDMQNIPRWLKLVESYPKRLEALITTRAGLQVRIPTQSGYFSLVSEGFEHLF